VRHQRRAPMVAPVLVRPTFGCPVLLRAPPPQTPNRQVAALMSFVEERHPSVPLRESLAKADFSLGLLFPQLCQVWQTGRPPCPGVRSCVYVCVSARYARADVHMC
jgi:hypothetical protein